LQFIALVSLVSPSEWCARLEKGTVELPRHSLSGKAATQHQPFRVKCGRFLTFSLPQAVCAQQSPHSFMNPSQQEQIPLEDNAA